MRFELLVGLQVLNDDKYQQYRDKMKPILSAYGGGFSYDFIVNKVLLAETANKINRVFVIYFPDKDTMENFFLDSAYLKVKTQYFEGAVENTTVISSYERPE